MREFARLRGSILFYSAFPNEKERWNTVSAQKINRKKNECAVPQNDAQQDLSRSYSLNPTRTGKITFVRYMVMPPQVTWYVDKWCNMWILFDKSMVPMYYAISYFWRRQILGIHSTKCISPRVFMIFAIWSAVKLGVEMFYTLSAFVAVLSSRLLAIPFTLSQLSINIFCSTVTPCFAIRSITS